jgi:hypothetical protein
MKAVNYLLAGALLMMSDFAFGQKFFNDCSAAFLNNKMVVDEYAPNGKCKLGANAVGTLTVCTADLSETGNKAKEKISFRIAIRDKNTKTLVMFSDETYQEVNIEKVMEKCTAGDNIVLLTTNSQYALPHNEIQVL